MSISSADADAAVILRRNPVPSIITQKAQLTYKLFLLEKARDALERDARAFTNTAYEEVQGFLSSSFPTSVFNELSSTLDLKCRTVDKLSSILKDLTAQPRVQPVVKNGERRNQSQPLRHKGRLKTDVLKFGPMLHNVLMVSSIAKAVQVLGAALSLRQLKHFLISQSAAIQEDDMICSVSSSYSRAVQTASLSCRLKAGGEEQAVIFEEKCQEDDVILPPAIIGSAGIDTGGPPLLLPPTQAIFPEVSNPKPMKVEPLSSWGKGIDVVVQHQKQTSSQLLHFLRAKAKIIGAMEVTFIECSQSVCASGSSQQTTPDVETQTSRLSHVVTDEQGDAPPLKALCADFDNEAPVFKVKRVESSGSLTYSCVIATKTELWDVGNIFTEVAQRDPDGSLLETTSCQHPTAADENCCAGVRRAPEKEQEPSAKMSVSDKMNIPQFQIRKFEETEVVVSHVVSPGSFYIQHADGIAKLRSLIAGSWKATSSYALQNSIPDIGTQVMAWFPKQEQWCRAQVTKICGVSRGFNATDSGGNDPSIKVEVKRLDFGDTACLSLLDIKELTPDMTVLPLQSVQVSLANVTPVNGTDWSEEAVGWFKEMVHNRTLYARFYPQGPRVAVELFLEKGKLGAMRRGASLSLRLAQNGHAKHSKLKNVGLSSVKLRTRERRSDWEKYLISCYTQHKKQSL